MRGTDGKRLGAQVGKGKDLKVEGWRLGPEVGWKAGRVRWESDEQREKERRRRRLEKMYLP